MSSFDVVVPCYRYGPLLSECVRSVLAQDIPDLRVLIIDDESPDNTPDVGRELCRLDPRVSYRRHAVNRGHIATYNEGIDWASADYMLLLSADDYLLPGALKRVAALMDDDPHIGLCFGEAVELQPDGSTRSIRVDVDAHGNAPVVMNAAGFVDLCIRGGAVNVVPTPTAVVRTELLKRLGGYRADLPHSGDMEMWLRFAAHASVGVIKDEQAVYRRHATNMSLNYDSLSDLRQRKTAFDVFRETCKDALPQAERLYRDLLKALGLQAVARASGAFNANRMEVSRQLCAFAVSVYPAVRWSRAWNLLLCKKWMGLQMSTALLPIVRRLRGETARDHRPGRTGVA